LPILLPLQTAPVSSHFTDNCIALQRKEPPSDLNLTVLKHLNGIQEWYTQNKIHPEDEEGGIKE